MASNISTIPAMKSISKLQSFNDNQAEIIYTTMIGLFRADNPFAGAGSSDDAKHIDHRKEIRMMATRHNLHASMLSGFLVLPVGDLRDIREAEARAILKNKPAAKKSAPAAQPAAKPEVRVKQEPKEETERTCG